MRLDRIIQERRVPARKSLGGGAGIVVGQNKPGGGWARKATGWGCNVELREEIRYAALDFTLLTIDLDSNPEIHSERSRYFPVIQCKQIRSTCTLPHIWNSSSHA